jgi:hypothetical protein
MSIEQALAENTASNLALASALNANTQILEKLEAGREAALAQLENKSDKPATTRRSRAKADEPAGQPTAEATGGNASAAAADTASQAGGATAAAEPTLPTVSEDDLRTIATGYIKGAGENVDDRKARAANIKSITDNFGTADACRRQRHQGPDAARSGCVLPQAFQRGSDGRFLCRIRFRR